MAHTKAVVWDSGYESSPAENDSMTSGDDAIRTLKSEIAGRFDTEHYIGDGLSGNELTKAGLHRPGSACAYVASYANAPAASRDGLIWYDTTNQVFKISSGGVWTQAATPASFNSPVANNSMAIEGVYLFEGFLLSQAVTDGQVPTSPTVKIGTSGCRLPDLVIAGNLSVGGTLTLTGKVSATVLNLSASSGSVAGDIWIV